MLAAARGAQRPQQPLHRRRKRPRRARRAMAKKPRPARVHKGYNMSAVKSSLEKVWDVGSRPVPALAGHELGLWAEDG